MSTRCWEDFAVGQKLATAAVTVTEAHVVGFAALTGDWYPLHVDEEYARQTVFGGRIAHGPLTFSLAVGLVGQTGVFGDSIVAYLGADNLRFHAPVRLGDTIRVEVEVTGRRETSNPARGVTVMRYTVKNQRNESVMTVDQSFLMHRRQASASRK